MQTKDIKLLLYFTLRTGMYTPGEKRETIIAFLAGYEIGRDKECDFSEKLSSSIKAEYKIDKRNMGWVGQIDRLANKLDLDWVSVLKKQILKVLIKELHNTPEEAECLSFIKDYVNTHIRGVSHHTFLGRQWIIDWFGIVDLKANWTKTLWSEKELELMTELEQELKHYGKVHLIDDKIKPTENLKRICAQLFPAGT